MNSDDEEYVYVKLKAKKKNQTFLPKFDYLELIPRRRRQGKCLGADLELYDFLENELKMEDSEKQQVYSYISNDIWFHLANYIAPEDVVRYSLICRQSANSVNCRTFWLQMYRSYCQQTSGKSKKWVLELPGHLQMQHIKDCDRITLRHRVIEALFHCHPYFQKRLQTPYALETLVGRIYVSSWYTQVECTWIMCYKFKLHFPQSNTNKCVKNDPEDIENAGTNDIVVDDWECLAEEDNNNLCRIKKSPAFSTSIPSTTNNLDGISILVICCDRFIPFPSDAIFNHDTNLLHLAACRNMLSTDMRSKNLELDFVSSSGDQTVTVKYEKIKKYKVLPWWHPDFRTFNKCQ